MKRTIKRRLSILLALVMLFSLLPTLSAPVSAEPAPTAIDSVGVSLTRPVVGPSSVTGDGVPGEATITAGEHSSVEKVRWYKGEGEGIGLGDFDAFENGKQYFAEIYLTAEDGYAFTADTTVTLSGAEKKATDVQDGGKTLCICTENITPTPSTISSVALSVTEPTAGATVPSYIVDVNNAGVSAESGANYTVVESGWLQNDGAGGSEYTTDTEFQAGKTYLLFATLSPNEGYQFSEECTGKVNGAAADDYYRRTPDLIVYKEFTIPAAETTYPVWVGGVQLTSENIDGTAIPGVKYDPSTFTLTLTDADITGAYGVVGIRSEGIDLVIEGKGIVMASGAVGIAVSKKDGSGGSLTIDADLSVSGIFGMNVENTLTIKGGELTISLSASASTAITAGAVDVQGGTVWANSSGNYAFNVRGDFKISAGDVTAQYGNYGIYAGGDVEITGGTLTVDSALYGISAGGNMEITGGMVTAKSDGSTGKGIMAENGDITISGASTKVIAEGTKKGILAGGDITISGGTVTAKGGEEGIEAGTGTITISGGTVVAEATGSSGIGIQAKGKITVSGDGTAVTGNALSGSCGVRTDGAIEVNGGSLEGKCAETGYGIYADGGISFAATHEIVIPEGGTLSESSKTIFASGGGGAAAHAKIAPKEVTYPVWVQGIQVKDSNKDNVLGDGKVVFTPASGSTPHTLTLSGASISDTTEEPAIYTMDADLLVTGSATISVTNDSRGIRMDKDESSGGTLTLENAQLTISGGSIHDAIDAYNMSIENSTVEITGFSGGIRTNDGDLTISGSTVNAACTNFGFHVDGTLTIANDITSVHAKSTSATALSAMYGKTIVLGDQLMIKTPEGGEIGTGLGELYHGQVIFESGGTTQAKEVLIVPKEPAYPLWVGGMQVKDSNKDAISTVTGGSAKYDPASNTLTLTGVTGFTGMYYASSPNQYYGIFYNPDSASECLNIVLEGENKFTDFSWNNILIDIDEGSAVISGSGTLTVSTGKPDMVVWCANDLTVSAAMDLVADRCCLLSLGTLTISADVTASSGDMSSAISAGNVVINGGRVEAINEDIGAYNWAIEADNGITIAATHAIVLPAGGEVGATSSGYYILDSSHNKVKHVIIEPIDVAYPVWVGGMQVKDSNKTDILGDGTAKFDPATNTLTLDGLNVGDGLHASGASIVSTGIDLTVTGSATLTGSGYGIWVINLSGGGSLTLDKAEITYAGDSASDVGVKADGDITIKDSKLELSAKNNGVCAGGAISIDGGTVKAEATDANNGTAIEAAGDISISNADVTAAAGNGPFTTGVYSETGDITISGGTVTATAGGGGVYAFGGEVKIENGTEKVEATVGTVAVRGKTGVTIGDELMIKLPEGGEVKSKSGFYEIMDGTDTARHALIVPKEATVYTVTFDANSGSGTMTPNPVTVVAGKKLTLPACTFTPPSADKEFDKWEAGKPGDEVEITSDCVIRAIWKEKTAPVTYTVTVTDDGNGTATASPASGASGDEVTLTATPKSGYKFKEWKVVSGGVTVTDNKFKIGTANVEIQAIFEEATAPVTYTVTVTDDGNGTATASPASGASGDEVTLTATPKSGFKFKEWKVVSGGVTVTDNKFKIGTANVEIQAIFEKEAAPVPAVYTVVGGGDSEWTKGSGKTLTVTVKRDPNDSECFSHFASVELGGKTLTAGTDYDAKSGSTIVTIKAAALEKLAAGKHTISILFDDGKAETKVTIKAGAAAGAKDSSPKTGQERTMIIWVPLMLVSGLGLCAVLITDKKRRPAGRH